MSQYIDDTPITDDVLVREIEHAVSLNLDRTYSAKGIHLAATVNALVMQRAATEFHRQCAADANAQLRMLRGLIREYMVNDGSEGGFDALELSRVRRDIYRAIAAEPPSKPAALPLEIAGSLLPDDYVSPRLAAEAYRECGAQAASESDLIEKVVEYGDHRENEGGSYATFQKLEARRHRADADEVLVEIRAMLAAQQNREKGQ